MVSVRDVQTHTRWGLLVFVVATAVNIGLHCWDMAHSSQAIAMPAYSAQTSNQKVLYTSPLIQHPETAGNNTYTVPLTQDDRALMLKATLDNQQTATFVLDTGATYTAISRDLAIKLGYNLNEVPQVSITTANGQVSFPKIRLKTLTLNGYTAHDVEATVMPLPSGVPFSGLLGLNFIRHQRITIDSQAEHLLIEPVGA